MELRHIALLPFIVTSLISYSCQNEEQYSSSAEREYSEVSDKIIEFSSCFAVNEQDYYVYIFSPFCGHCRKIKNSIIEFALKNIYPTYFIYYTEEIEVTSDVSFTIGANSIFELAILGVPTLIYIEEKVVKSNIAGADKILKIIDPY